MSFNANALSCVFPLEIIFECKDGLCKEGFLGFHKLSGHRCSNILNVNSQDKIYSLDDPNSYLKNLSTGVFSVKFVESELVRDVEHLEWARCVKLDQSEKLLINCPISEVKSLSDYSSLKEAIKGYADETSVQKLTNYLLTYTFPLLFLLIVIGKHSRFSKNHNRKFLVAIVFCTLFGIFNLLTWGHYIWILAGLIGLLYLIVISSIGIFDRVTRKPKAQK